ncbi:MAG: hypothetical protein HYZ91_06305 [Candidatus Omnitrophica bacterium]|nr:hypothetical protein [Candidatus Omnitrophota bacterium]
MKKIWVHKARSFEEAERFERRYYQAMSATERVETVDWLRQVARKLQKRHGGTPYVSLAQDGAGTAEEAEWI